MYEKGIFLYLLYGTFDYFKDTIINQQKIGKGFLSLNSQNYKGIQEIIYYVCY